jgi:UDP-N-acetyl-D-mannosaminuronic acid dehydrogenase
MRDPSSGFGRGVEVDPRLRVTIVGGCGHVGLPLGLTLADCSISTTAFDIDAMAVASVNDGMMPFAERGASEVLERTLASGLFRATTDPASVHDATIIIIVIGTPVDNHLSPDPNAVLRAVKDVVPYLRSDQLIVLRSTVYPGVTRGLQRFLRSQNLSCPVVFCPERILEGHAMTELRELPQIIGTDSRQEAQRAIDLFGALGVRTIIVTPEEAELAKLFTNAWRYIKFAAANQFWLMATEADLDYGRIREAVVADYPRASDLPTAGFAAGPCLFKDTAQLAAFTNNTFTLGNAAMLVNEGQPLYLVDRISQSHDLSRLTVGILGMAFKAESDDTRSSLSYKLKRILRFRAGEVLTTDPYVTSDPELLPLEEVMERSDLLVIGAPHGLYRELVTDKPVYDVWGLRSTGTLA